MAFSNRKNVYANMPQDVTKQKIKIFIPDRWYSAADRNIHTRQMAPGERYEYSCLTDVTQQQKGIFMIDTFHLATERNIHTKQRSLTNRKEYSFLTDVIVHQNGLYSCQTDVTLPTDSR